MHQISGTRLFQELCDLRVLCVEKSLGRASGCGSPHVSKGLTLNVEFRVKPLLTCGPLQNVWDARFRLDKREIKLPLMGGFVGRDIDVAEQALDLVENVSLTIA